MHSGGLSILLAQILAGDRHAVKAIDAAIDYLSPKANLGNVAAAIEILVKTKALL
jgi:hypothetical protein